MSFATATLTGTYQLPNGTPARGFVEIIPNSKVVVDQAGNVIRTGRTKVDLDTAGHFSVSLVATDDATLEPAIGRQYTILVTLHDSRTAVPKLPGITLATGTTVDTADLTSGVEASAVYSAFLTKVQYDALVTDVATKALLQQVAATVTVDGAAAVNRHNPVDATSANRAITLPTGQAEGTQISVEKTDATTNTVTVTGSIRGVGSSSVVLPWQNESIVLRADSTGSWWPYAGHKTKTTLDTAYKVPLDALRAGTDTTFETRLAAAYVHKDAQIWSAKDHSVVGDGVTDDTQAIKDFLNATIAAGVTAFFPPGSYVSSWFYVNGAPKVFAHPGTVKILMSQTNDGWNFGPTTYGATTTLTADAAQGATQLALTAIPTGVAVGSIIMVGDTALKVGGNSPTNTIASNNLYRVTGISGNTVTIAGGTTTVSSGSPTPRGLVRPVTAATGVVTALSGMVDDASVRGLAFESTAGATNTATALTFRQVRNVEVEVSTKGFGNANLVFTDCWAPRVKARVSQALNIDVSGTTGQFGYGVLLNGATAHAFVDVHCDQARHAVSLSGTGHDARITGVATNCTSSAWDAHAGFSHATFIAATADGCVNGYALRGDKQDVQGGSVDNCGAAVVVFDRPLGVTVKGLLARNCANGVLVNSIGSPATPGVSLTVDGCTFGDMTGAAIDFPTTNSAFTDVRILNNSFRNSGVGSSAPHIRIAAALTRLRIHRNLFEDNQGTPSTTAGVNITVAASDGTFVNNDVQNSLTAIIGSQSGTLTVPPSVFTPTKTSYTTPGTYTFTVPATCNQIAVTCIGAGSGGGSGRQGATSTARTGGGGGGAGGLSTGRFAPGELTGTVTVTVGTGGAGAAAQATVDTNGTAGSVGTLSSFGTYVRALPGSTGAAGSTTAVGAASGGGGTVTGNAGGSGSLQNGNGSNFTTGGPGGGGAAGSVTTGNVAGTGGGGGLSAASSQGTAGTGGAATGANGTSGVGPTLVGLPGPGGGGGGAQVNGTGGNGGDGVAGGGGGGGAASTDGFSSGAGGRGGDGVVIVICT